MLLILSRDLIFCSRFHAATESAALESQTALSADQARAAFADGGVTGVCIDLETPDLDLEALVGDARRANASCQIVAYGPHVHESLLQSAREAGCDHVLSRGEFDRMLPSLLQQLPATP